MWDKKNAFFLTSWSKWREKLFWLTQNHLRSRKWGFEVIKGHIASHHFSSLTEMMPSTSLMKSILEASSLFCHQNINSLQWKTHFNFDFRTHFLSPFTPCELLKWHQEEVCEGQDENSGERDWEGRRGRCDRKRGNWMKTEWDIEEEKKQKGDEKKTMWKAESERDGNVKETDLLCYHSSMSLPF